MRDYTDSNAHGYILTYLYIGRFLSILNRFSYYSIFRNERIFTGGGDLSFAPERSSSLRRCLVPTVVTTHLYHIIICTIMII